MINVLMNLCSVKCHENCDFNSTNRNINVTNMRMRRSSLSVTYLYVVFNLYTQLQSGSILLD